MNTVSEKDGHIERLYVVPPVATLQLKAIILNAPLSGNPGRHRTVASVSFDGDMRVNGERVHPHELVRWCDAVLGQFSGEQLARARAL